MGVCMRLSMCMCVWGECSTSCQIKKGILFSSEDMFFSGIFGVSLT